MRNDSAEFFGGIDLGDKSNKVAVLGWDNEEPETAQHGQTVH
jgi:hypothetical protein